MVGSDLDMEAEWAVWLSSREVRLKSPEGIEQPSPDRLTMADRVRFAVEYDATRQARHALLALNAPWWRRALARLPNPKQPLEDWIAAAKRRISSAK